MNFIKKTISCMASAVDWLNEAAADSSRATVEHVDGSGEEMLLMEGRDTGEDIVHEELMIPTDANFNKTMESGTPTQKVYAVVTFFEDDDK